MSAGRRFREALSQEKPLQIVGTINAYHALIAERVGYRAIYLSGGGVAAGSLGMPDLGICNLDDVLTDVRRITDVCDLPLLVDVDTGFGASAFNVARTTSSLIKSGAAAMHIEDQVGAKRCGHRPGKELVTADEMADRIKAAVDARSDPSFVVMARTDALAVEGLDPAVSRARACVEAGADVIFPEAITDLPMYRKFADAVKVPVLANITEFGKSPLFTVEELRSAGVGMILYPLTAFRAMNAAALKVYENLRKDGTQKSVIDDMQTRAELYDILDYHAYERKLDELFSRGRSKPKKSVALSGVPAGNTALCTVGRSGNDLHYRGYDILDFADEAEFEEIAYLLVHEKLPTGEELRRYKASLRALRGLPAAVKAALEHVPPSRAPDGRDAHRRLGAGDPGARERGPQRGRRARIADRLMASLGSMLLYWYHYSHNGKRIETETDDDSIGGHFLHLLHGKPPSRRVGARHAHLAHPLRRARVQRLDLHLPGGRRHGLRHALGDLRRHRRAARPEARRRERVRLRGAVRATHARRGGEPTS